MGTLFQDPPVTKQSLHHCACLFGSGLSISSSTLRSKTARFGDRLHRACDTCLQGRLGVRSKHDWLRLMRMNSELEPLQLYLCMFGSLRADAAMSIHRCDLSIHFASRTRQSRGSSFVSHFSATLKSAIHVPLAIGPGHRHSLASHVRPSSGPFAWSLKA